MATNDIFRCLADPVRRSILELPAVSDLPVTAVASHVEVSRPAISRHLRVLRDAGLVAESRSGRQRIYRLHTQVLESVADWVEEVAARRGVGSAPRSGDEDGRDQRVAWRQW